MQFTILYVNHCVCSSSFCLQAVHTLVALQKRYVASIGKLTPAEEDSIWQVIIGQRAQVSLRCHVWRKVVQNKPGLSIQFLWSCTVDLQQSCLSCILFSLSWQVNDKLDECKRFESSWVSAVKLCETAAEAAYTSGVQKKMSACYTAVCLNGSGCHGWRVEAGFLILLLWWMKACTCVSSPQSFIHYCLCLFLFSCC